MLFRYIFFMVLALFATTVVAGTRDPAVSDSKHIEYGKKFQCIYKICGTYENGQLFCASAVIIDPHWILTAAHVVNNARFCVVSQDNKANFVDKIIVHKDFVLEKFGSADIALGYMEKPINLDFYPSLYQDRNEQDKICSIAGYGLTGTFKTGVNFTDDKRRAGSNIVEFIDRELLVCNASSRSDRKSTDLEFLIASGDSGGGLFIDGKLAGINSGVMAADKKADSSYTDESAHTRISSYIEWIKETIKLSKLPRK